MLQEFLRRLRYYRHRREFEADLDEELRYHLAMKRRDSGEEAGARRQFGNITLLKEESRATWSWTWCEQLLQDFRYALRTALHNRAFTALAALSLALGIGANTAIYSFLEAILLRSLPVSDPASLAVLNWHAPRPKSEGFVMYSMSGHTYDDGKGGGTGGIFPYHAFEVFRQNGSALSVLFAFYPARDLNLTSNGQSDLSRGEYISGDYFRGLGVPPAAGRLILADDDRAGAPPVAVISHAFSEKRFGGPAGAPGQSILVNNVPFAVVGVTPPEFFGVDPSSVPDIYLPMHTNLLLETDRRWGAAAAYRNDNHYWIEIMGRLRSGATLEQAQKILAPLFSHWVESTAANDRERANLPQLELQPGVRGIDRLRRLYSKPLYVLLAMVALILAIACSNVANLLLARAASRRREIALRLSVGAGRARVVRQLLTESLVLAVTGGTLGVLFAIWGIRFLTVLLVNGDANFRVRVDLSWPVLTAAAALSFLTGIIFGLVPALQATRVEVMPALKETRSGREARTPRWRVTFGHTFVVAQVALSLLLLAGAGLFVRTLANLQSIELGFNRENILLFKMNPRQAGHQDPEVYTFYSDLLRRFRAIPGVRDATLSNSPLVGAGSGFPVSVPGEKPDDANRIMAVGPGYFRTMQIPLLAGRDIEERDGPGSPLVAVVSERFAQINFPGRNPLGEHLTMTPRDVPHDAVIAGVAKNAHYGGLKEESPPVIYFPYNHGLEPKYAMTFALRTAGDPLRYVKTVREIVHRADSRVPLAGVESQTAQIDHTINQEILFAELCSCFATLALVIAGVGLYSTVSCAVSRRTGEIGIRMALGAQRGSVTWMVLREVLVLAIVGLVVSVPAAWAASKVVASFLFGMKPNDPLALTLAFTTLFVSAVVAGYVPAWKASRIDPTAALRHE